MSMWLILLLASAWWAFGTGVIIALTIEVFDLSDWREWVECALWGLIWPLPLIIEIQERSK